MRAGRRRYCQAPLLPLVIAGDIRGGRAHQAHCPGQAGVLDGGLAGMVMRRAFGLVVGIVVALVHHDQPQPVERGEQGAARPDDQAQLASRARRQVS